MAVPAPPKMQSTISVPDYFVVELDVGGPMRDLVDHEAARLTLHIDRRKWWPGVLSIFFVVKIVIFFQELSDLSLEVLLRALARLDGSRRYKDLVLRAASAF